MSWQEQFQESVKKKKEEFEKKNEEGRKASEKIDEKRRRAKEIAEKDMEKCEPIVEEIVKSMGTVLCKKSPGIWNFLVPGLNELIEISFSDGYMREDMSDGWIFEPCNHISVKLRRPWSYETEHSEEVTYSGYGSFFKYLNFEHGNLDDRLRRAIAECIKAIRP